VNRLKRIRLWLKGRLAWVLVPIIAGPLRGSWFGLFTGTRFIHGDYGVNETAVIQRLVKSHDVVFDIGAHVGYFTLLASRIAAMGKVFSFEPLPANLAYLRRHVRANGLSNVTVFAAAVGRRSGRQSFDLAAGGTGRGRLAAAGAAPLEVQVVSLDELMDGGRVQAPDFIKMDVEGAEGDALRGAARMLARFHPRILLSLHGEAAARDCEALLRGLGYRLSPVEEGGILAEAV
jgi:FkbM family methyltransferase